MTSVCIAMGLGCPRSEVDVARLFEYVRQNGWGIADSMEDADVVLVASCAFIAELEDVSFNLLESARKRMKPGARFVVLGCLAGICEERLAETFGIQAIPWTNGHDLDELLGASVGYEDVSDPPVIDEYVKSASQSFSDRERHPNDNAVVAQLRRIWGRVEESRRYGWRSPWAAGKTACSLRVARGCDGECTYCAIRFGAGPLHSKPLAQVLAEFDSGLSQGHRHFTVIAGDLGAYGQDIGTNVAELLGELMARQTQFELTLFDFDMKYFIKYSGALIPLLAANADRVRYLSLPLQSGSEAILQQMRRGHSAADAERSLVALRAACPKLVLNTQILIGFPGETEKDLEDTLRVLRRARFDSVSIYDYQDRPNTVASRMPGHVSMSTIRTRSLRARREFGGPFATLRYRLMEWEKGRHNRGRMAHASAPGDKSPFVDQVP